MAAHPFLKTDRLGRQWRLGFDLRELPPKGLRTRDIYISDLHMDTIRVKTRGLR